MSWKGDVEALLDRVPPRFTLADLYRFVPLLHQKHPENYHVEEKVRQVLQMLRDEGRLQFLEGGSYQQVAEHEPIVTDLPLKIGELTTRAELARMMKMASDAPLRRGMFKPAKGPYRNQMFLFHNETENPYGDAQEGDAVRYVGQGMGRDQEMMGFNATLANHLDTGVDVHYFVQPREHPGQVRYVGPVVVDSYEQVYRQQEGRSVWIFTLLPAKRAGVAEHVVEEYGRAYSDVLDYGRPPGPVDRLVVSSIVNRKIRDKAFGRVVITAYDKRCAVCGDPLRKGHLSELEAAHIRSVEALGPDDPRNGLSLCRRHHWAFDHGFFTLTDQSVVRWLSPRPDPHKEISEGHQLHVPKNDALRPHPEYLKWHRAEWEGLISELGI